MNEFDNLINLFNKLCELTDEKDFLELKQDIVNLCQSIILNGETNANQLASHLLDKYDNEINGTIIDILHNTKALKTKDNNKPNVPTENENCFLTLQSLIKFIIKKYYEKYYENRFINAQPLNYRQSVETLLNIIKNIKR